MEAAAETPVPALCCWRLRLTRTLICVFVGSPTAQLRMSDRAACLLFPISQPLRHLKTFLNLKFCLKSPEIPHFAPPNAAAGDSDAESTEADTSYTPTSNAQGHL